MYLRILIAAVLVVIVVVGGVVIFVGGECDPAAGCNEEASLFERLFASRNPTDTESRTEPIATQSLPRLPAPSPEPAVPQTARAVPGQTQTEPPPPVAVDSLPREAQYDILKWNLVAYKSGSVDIVRTESGAAPENGVLTLRPGELIVLTGWAGHPAYGLRFRDVLFSFCGKVVGRAAVQGERPDVAKAVHLNLGNSGWTAKLAADQLPRCEQQVLQVWGVAPIGRNIFPLNGNAPIRFEGVPPPVAARYRQRVETLTPDRNGVAELRKITIRASALRIRRCGGTGCDVVGRITAGAYDGYVLETVGGWTLFQIGETVGWVNSKYLTVL